MKEKHFAKAQGLANEDREAIALVFDLYIPDFNGLEASMDWYELEGERLESALSHVLSSGVYDELLSAMLRRRKRRSNDK